MNHVKIVSGVVVRIMDMIEQNVINIYLKTTPKSA